MMIILITIKCENSVRNLAKWLTLTLSIILDYNSVYFTDVSDWDLAVVLCGHLGTSGPAVLTALNWNSEMCVVHVRGAGSNSIIRGTHEPAMQ